MAGGMNVVKGGGKKLVPVLLFLAVVFLVISQPTEMAEFVNGLIAWFKQAATSLGTFVRSLSG